MADHTDQNSPPSDTNEEKGNVQVLPPEERENFQGITIDTGEQKEQNRNYYEYDYRDPKKRVYVRHINLKGGVFSWLALGLFVITVILVALPFLLFIIAPMIIVLLLNSLFRRRR